MVARQGACRCSGRALAEMPKKASIAVLHDLLGQLPSSTAPGASGMILATLSRRVTWGDSCQVGVRVSTWHSEGLCIHISSQCLETALYCHHVNTHLFWWVIADLCNNPTEPRTMIPTLPCRTLASESIPTSALYNRDWAPQVAVGWFLS